MMNNKLIRVLSIILVFSVVFSFTAFAEETENSPVEGTTTQISENETNDVEDPTEPGIPEEPTDTPDTPEIPDEPDKPEPPKPTFDELPGDTVVGRMYICTQIVFLGHSWIYVENTFDGTIPFGCITIEPNKGGSAGTFLFTRSDGMGVYYNVEQYCSEHYGLVSEAWLGMDITKDQLEKVNDEITSWNYWGLYLNCTFFASKVWNSVSDDFIMPMMFPIFTKAQINTKGGNSDVIMKHVEPEECYKQRGTGKNVRAEEVSYGTLDSRLL